MRRIAVLIMLLAMALSSSASARELPPLTGTLYFVQKGHSSYSFHKLTLPAGEIAELGQYSGTGVWNAVWSPDGTRVAFHTHNLLPASEIMVYSFADKKATRLTFNEHFDGHPTWSPDGTRIAFASDCDEGIYVINRDGTGLSRLLPGRLRFPAWSPKDDEILFTAIPRDLPGFLKDTSPNGFFALFASPIYGAEFLRSPEGFKVPLFKRYVRLNILFAYSSRPAWSPSGRYMSFLTKSTFAGGLVNSTLIWVMSRDRERHWALVGRIPEHGHCWSPDGRYIAYIDKGTRQKNAVWATRYDNPGSEYRLTPKDMDVFGVGWGE